MSKLLISNSMWLCTRSAHHGRLACAPELATTAVGAALLGEQLLLQTMSIQDGHITIIHPLLPPLPDTACGDPAAALAARGAVTMRGTIVTRTTHTRDEISVGRADELVAAVYAEAQVRERIFRTTTVTGWLEHYGTAGDAYGRVCQRLQAAGTIHYARSGRLRGRDFIPVDDNAVATMHGCVSIPLAQRRTDMTRADILLAALVRAAHLGGNVFDDRSLDADRHLTELVNVHLGPQEHALIDATREFAARALIPT